MSSDICGICYSDYSFLYDDLICNHKFCVECLQKHIEQYLENNNDAKIPCPFEYCDEKIKNGSILSILEENEYLLEKYNKKINDDGAQIGINAAMCPDCNKICKKQYSDNNKIQCPECDNYFCFICKENHSGEYYYINCPNERDMNDDLEMVSDAVGNNNVKLCPLCKIILFKEEGCSASMCKYCKIKFCWECMRTSYQIKKLNNHDCSSFDRYLNTDSGDEYNSGSDLE